jgi:hypothetical protein
MSDDGASGFPPTPLASFTTTPSLSDDSKPSVSLVALSSQQVSAREPDLSLVESEQIETEVDFLGDAENIKTLFKLPYSNSTVSLAIHKLGNTLIVDGEQENSHASPYHQQSQPTALPAPGDESESARERDMFEQFIYESYMAAKAETDNPPVDIETEQERDMFEQFIYESYMAAKAENEQGPGNVSESEGSERDQFEQFIFQSYMAAKEEEKSSPERHRAFSPLPSAEPNVVGVQQEECEGRDGALVKGREQKAEGRQLKATRGQPREQPQEHMQGSTGMPMSEYLPAEPVRPWAGTHGVGDGVGAHGVGAGFPTEFPPQSFGASAEGSMTHEYRQVVSWKFHEMNIVTGRYE